MHQPTDQGFGKRGNEGMTGEESSAKEEPEEEEEETARMGSALHRVSNERDKCARDQWRPVQRMQKVPFASQRR